MNITIAGATYSDVPHIEIPKVGGGYAEFYDMSSDVSWMGKDATCINENFYSKSDTLDNTGFNGWTPSTSALVIVSSATAGTFVADMANYEYYLIWECKCDPAYTGTPTLKGHFLFTRTFIVQEIAKRPSTFVNIGSMTFDGNNSSNIYTNNFLRYYGTTTGTMTYSWGASYGFFFGATAATFSNSTSNTPIVTVRTPTLATRCSATYFSTGNAAKVDQKNSTWSIKCKIYRIKPNGINRGIYKKVAEMVNS